MNLVAVDFGARPAAPNASLSPVASVAVGDQTLHLIFTPDLVERASGAMGRNLWAVTVQGLQPGAPRAIFMRETPPLLIGADLVPPMPALVLATLASDLGLALAMPSDVHAAVDWLFTEGYATWPSDAIKMHCDLSSTLAEASALLEGTGIGVVAFHAALDALPVVLAPCLFRGDACPVTAAACPAMSIPVSIPVSVPAGAR